MDNAPLKYKLKLFRKKNQKRTKKMAEKNELSSQDNFYLKLIKLGMAYNFTNKKLTREDIYAIQDPCTDTKDNKKAIKFLKRLFALDFRSRSSMSEQPKEEEALPDQNQTDDYDFFTTKTNSNDSMKISQVLQISNADLLICTLAVCDNFLIQDVFEKMTLCQLAVPIILPKGDSLIFHLWATRSIRKKWVQTLQDGSLNIKEGNITNKEMACISFCRFGPIKTSKSKLANSILSSCQGWPEQSYFLNRDIDSPSQLNNGVLEAQWYCPEGRPCEKLKDITCIYNLRGDVRKNRKQFAFLLSVSSTIVILTENGEMKPKEIELINKAKDCKIVMVDLGHEGKKTSFGLKTKIFGSGLNFKSLSDTVTEGIGTTFDKKSSLEQHAEILNSKSLFLIDENAESACLKAKKAAHRFIEQIQRYPIGKQKHEIVPLQGYTWQKWAELDKEEARHQFLGASDPQIYSDSLREQKGQLRLSQFQLGPSKEVLEFIMQLSCKETRRYFIQWCQMAMNEMSEIHLPLLLKDYNDCSQKLSSLSKKLEDQKNNLVQRKTLNENIQLAKEELKVVSQKFSQVSFGIEHIFREFSQIFESKADNVTVDLRSYLPKLMAELFLLGEPFEIMDGDTSHIPLSWVLEVLNQFGKLIGENSRVFVVSILGIQSSGKSTLLNTFFGSKFAVSSGRCTKGVFLQVLPVSADFRDKICCDYFIIMDSEGLRSPELSGSFRHDNEIATLVACLANTTIINFWGQTFSKDMADIMQIVAHAYIRMKEVKIKSSFHLVFAGVLDVTAEEKNRLGVTKIIEELNDMILKAASREGQEETFNGLNSIFPLLSEQLPQLQLPEFFPTLWQSSMCPPESRYGEIANKLKDALCKGLMTSLDSPIKTQPLKEFVTRLGEVWEAIKLENFIFGFKNTKQIEIYTDLQRFYDKEISKIRKEFYQLAWDIGEASLKQISKAKEETAEIQKYNTRIERDMIPKMDNFTQEFENDLRVYVTQLQDPETASNFIAGFSIDLDIKMKKWLENERQQLIKQISSVCRKEKNAHVQREEHRKKCIFMAQGIAHDLKGQGPNVQINNDVVTIAFDNLFDNLMADANLEEAENTELVNNLFQHIWSKSLEHLTFKLESYLPRSRAEINKNVKEWFNFAKLQTNGHALVVVQFFPQQHLQFDGWMKRAKNLIFYMTDSVKTESALKVERIMSKLFQLIASCESETNSYFDCNGKIAELLEEIHKDLCDAEFHGWKFKKDFHKNFLLQIFSILVKEMEKIERKKIEENSLVFFLQNERENLYKEFKAECEAANNEVQAASRFVKEILCHIFVTQVKLSVGTTIFDALLATERFNQKNSMMYFLLEELIDEDFESFIVFIKDYKGYVLSWFRKELIILCKKDSFLQKCITTKLISTLEQFKNLLNLQTQNSHIAPTQMISVWWDKLQSDLKEFGFTFQVIFQQN